MDIFSTTVTVIQEVYTITVFVKGVISDVKNYDEDQRQLQLRLDVQLLFLDSFRHLFFDGDNGLLLPGRLSPRTSQVVLDLLGELENTLASYKVVAIKHGLLQDTVDSAPVPREELMSLATGMKSKIKSIKLKAYDWAIFDKSKLEKTIIQYEKWSGSLRDLMAHFLQVTRIFNDPPLLRSFADNEHTKGMGLEGVAKRKLLSIERPPDDFQELQGDIIDPYSPSGASQLRLAKYTLGAQTTIVVVEYHPYDSRLRQSGLRAQEIFKLKAPIRNLAWLLQSSSQPEDNNPMAPVPRQPAMYTLRCMGYMDQPSEERSCLLYQLPTSSSINEQTKITTLNDFISRTQQGKPMLGNRFALAHALALTVLNIHGSGWVHKNIWSRGIALFPNFEGDGIERQAERLQIPKEYFPASCKMLPYLADWGAARPVLGRTDFNSNFDLETNLYRHPDRQGQPMIQFRKIHDIYACGVVLLEIGCWTTVSMIFEDLLTVAEREETLPDATIIRKRLTEKIRTDVAREMGERYACAVLACLTGELGTDDDDKSDTALSIAFGKRVVDIIRKGTEL